MAPNKPYDLEFGGAVVHCADARAVAALLKELQVQPRVTRMKTHNTVGLTAKKALLEGPYRPAVDTLLASYPEGISGEDLLAKVGFSSAKGLGGYMTGFRKQCRIAGIPEDPVITERKKNGGGTWRNYFRLSERAAEILKKWLEG